MKLVILFFTLFILDLNSQVKDTSSIKTELTKAQRFKNHSPKKAALLSAILPGAGQVYNRKYWKVPIVWAGIGAFTTLYISTNADFQDAKSSYLTLIDTISTNNIAYKGSTDLTKITFQKNQLRNNRDMLLVFGILWYGLNIIDATIDAHLLTFDVSDDLALKIRPNIYNAIVYNPTVDFTLSLKGRNKNLKYYKLN